MKLNLLPTYVGKEKAVRSAIFLSVIVAAVGIGAGVILITSSRKATRDARQQLEDSKAGAYAAAAEAKKADAIVQNARVLIGNTKLAEAMKAHNSDYIDLYDQVRRYIPSYFRVISMSATPNGANATVTLTGVLQTQQQYADMRLALLRIPGATTVSAQDYQIVEKVIPPLSEGYQNGLPVDANAAPMPDDQLDRMAYLMNQPRTEGFLNQGGFGVEDPTTAKGAMPEWSQVTFQVVVPKNLNTPDPQATLAAIGQAAGQTGGGTVPAGGPPGPGGPGGFTPPVPGAGGPAGVAPPGGRGGALDEDR